MIRIDMDMPESCAKCRFCVPIITITCLEHDCFCSASSKLKYPKAETGFCISRPNWCPLEPIVTCGECRHWKNHGAESTAWTPCMDTEYSKDFFCGRAERKDSQQ